MTTLSEKLIQVDELEHRIRAALSRVADESPCGLRLLIEVMIVGEDKRFYRHPGFDILSVARALLVWVFGGRLYGASTIEQQLVRTLTGRYERTLGRKLSEITLAVLVSQRFSKTELAAAYLELAYFGHHANGVRQALARCGFSLSDLSLREAAYIAAMLKVPLPERPSRAVLERLERRAKYIEYLAERDPMLMGRVAASRIS